VGGATKHVFGGRLPGATVSFIGAAESRVKSALWPLNSVLVHELAEDLKYFWIE